MTIAQPPATEPAAAGAAVGANENSYTRRDLYEERQTVESGVGCFATAKISPGTRLFCEKSLVMLPDDAGHIALYNAVKTLPKERQAHYYSLAASSKPSKHVAWIDSLRATAVGSVDEMDGFNALVEEYELTWSIYETNRFTCKSPDGVKRLGVFPMCARLNHSCAPNVFHRYNPRIDRMTVHALRDIEPGEEILTSYIDICHPTVTRRKLLKGWGFRCRCKACDNPDDAEDYARKQIEEGFLKIGNREKKREKNEAKWMAQDYERTLAIVFKTTNLLEKERMEETDTLAITYALCVKLGIKCGQEEFAEGWARSVVEIERKCLGEDSFEYERALELLDMAKKACASSK